ncbi:MAG: helical backbone metal receptor [Gemmatimonadota bacterium]
MIPHAGRDRLMAVRSSARHFLRPPVIARSCAVFLSFAFAFGCEPEAPPPQEESFEEAEVVVVDDAGVRHDFTEPPSRVVSLVPSSTEILRALGAGDLLVARTDFDTARALAELPSVGGGLHPSLEALVSARPDLVIRFAGEQDVTTPARLSERGIPHFAVRPDGVDDVRRIIRSLSQIVGTPDAGAELVDRIDSDLAEILGRVEGEPPVRVAFLMGGSPPWAAGPGTFIDELIRIAGGVNVFGDLGSLYAPVSLEEIAVRDIDVVLHPGGDATGLRVGEVPVRRVSELTQSPGPRLGEAAREIARILHPDVFR